MFSSECYGNVLESECENNSNFLFLLCDMFSMIQRIQASSVLSVSETCLRLMDQSWTPTSWRFFLLWLTEMLMERSATRILLTW